MPIVTVNGAVPTLNGNALEVSESSATSRIFSISVSDWNGGTTCTKSVTGAKANSIIICDTSDNSVQCTGQSAGSLTFSASSTPASIVTVKAVIL